MKLVKHPSFLTDDLRFYIVVIYYFIILI